MMRLVRWAYSRSWGLLQTATVLLSISLGLTAHAAGESGERVQVTDPYIELHTGPGRGFPIFYVVERNAWIEIEMRHTDWFKVRAPGGQEGWVERAQLETTLTEAGNKKSFRDVLLDDYLRRRLEVGGGWGHFESDPFIKLWATYNLADTLALEATAGQVQGTYSGTNFWHVNLMAQPWSDKRLEPFLGIGGGRIYYTPNASLISAVSNNSDLADAMIGVRYHVTDRLIVRLDFTEYVAFLSDTQTQQYRAVALGLSFFF